MSTEPQSVDLAKPESRYEATKARENDKEMTFPRWKNHLLADKDGKYPAELNEWERTVIEAESKRAGFRFWYRNPDQPGQSSLGIAYIEDDQFKIMRPDFLFFFEENNRVVVDLVDPHGLHFADALPKLLGLTCYATASGDRYRRIVAVAEVEGRFRALDLKRPQVSSFVRVCKNAKEAFLSPHASDYE
jgi:hypothetical protein